jgi:hypothetical protein
MNGGACARIIRELGGATETSTGFTSVASERGWSMAAWSPWDQVGYCWVVICKNVRFHRHTNVAFGHKIPLGEADAVSPPPHIIGLFAVRCDECNKEYSYGPEDILRLELSLPESFTPHRLFV